MNEIFDTKLRNLYSCSRENRKENGMGYHTEVEENEKKCTESYQ